MEKQKYKELQSQLIQITNLIKLQIPENELDEFIRAINRAEAAGPVLNPTLYRKGADNLTTIKNYARGLKAFYNTINID